MANKRAAIFYNEPFLEITSGTHNRIINLLRYFKTSNILVDQVILSKKIPKIKLKSEETLINEIIYLKKRKISFIKKMIFLWKLRNKISKEEKQKLKELSIKSYKIAFLQEILRKTINVNNYDYFISVNSDNAFWIDCFSENTKKILLMEDAMFEQYKDRNLNKINNLNELVENYKNYEAKIIDKFDSIIGISQDEINIFLNDFNKDKFIYIPAFMNSKNIEKKDNYKYDIIYVAHDNFHNVKGCKWFMENVYPNLQDNKILFVGKICNTFKNKDEYSNINFIEYIKNLDDVYNNAKIAICPMFSGTGLKIKVVEAMSYGKPIICNSMGTVGLPDFKTINNKAIFVSEEPKAFIKYIQTLLNDSKLYNETTDEALKYFNKYFLTENNIAKLNSIFKI